jgi:hypothetical protein
MHEMEHIALSKMLLAACHSVDFCCALAVSAESLHAPQCTGGCSGWQLQRKAFTYCPAPAAAAAVTIFTKVRLQ